MAFEAFELRLGQRGREGIRREWEKAEFRLTHDDSGAITSARTMLECVCLHVLTVMNTPDTSKGDLPKLYSAVAVALGLGASNQLSTINKRMFGAVHTIIQAVGELRNKAGDAHGWSAGGVTESKAQADLAVYLAASVANFLLASLDSHIATAHRRTPEGEAILRFDRAMVWRLVDHARNAPSHLGSYGEKHAKAALWLVGDSGIYLMSNGSPPLLGDGKIVEADKAKLSLRLVAYAEGCGPSNEFDDWWPVHHMIAEGSDFSITIAMDRILEALESSSSQIVIVGTEEAISVYGDAEYSSVVK